MTVRPWCHSTLQIAGLDTSSALGAFERMEEKVMSLEAQAEAAQMVSESCLLPWNVLFCVDTNGGGGEHGGEGRFAGGAGRGGTDGEHICAVLINRAS